MSYRDQYVATVGVDHVQRVPDTEGVQNTASTIAMSLQDAIMLSCKDRSLCGMSISVGTWNPTQAHVENHF